MPQALTIAGSDSSGGAGIQADLKTFAALGIYGSSVITAVTAQNTTGVAAIFPLEAGAVTHQLEAVLEDLRPQVAKTGMLASEAIVAAVAEQLVRFDVQQVIVDPVIRSSSGTPLLEPAGVEMLRRRLLPLALVITPNLAEAGQLCGFPVDNRSSMRQAAQVLHGDGVCWVLIKGGHLDGEPVDLLYDGIGFYDLPGRREQGEVHGTGCTLAAALAGYLALGVTLPAAAFQAKEFVTQAIKASQAVGQGSRVPGPLAGLYRETQRYPVYQQLAATAIRLAPLGNLVEAVTLALPYPRDYRDLVQWRPGWRQPDFSYPNPLESHLIPGRPGVVTGAAALLQGQVLVAQHLEELIHQMARSQELRRGCYEDF